MYTSLSQKNHKAKNSKRPPVRQWLSTWLSGPQRSAQLFTWHFSYRRMQQVKFLLQTHNKTSGWWKMDLGFFSEHLLQNTWEWMCLYGTYCHARPHPLSPLWDWKCKKLSFSCTTALCYPLTWITSKKEKYFFSHGEPWSFVSSQKFEQKGRLTAQSLTLEVFYTKLSNQGNPLGYQLSQSARKVPSTSYLSNFITKPCSFL